MEDKKINQKSVINLWAIKVGLAATRMHMFRIRALSPIPSLRMTVAFLVLLILIFPSISQAAVYEYYAVSFDNRSSFKTFDRTSGDSGWRLIASKLNTDHGGTNGVWYYNSNTTPGATDETWTACTVNVQDNCIAQAMGVSANQMDRDGFEGISDHQWEDFQGWNYLSRADDINVAVGLKTTSTSETPVVADIEFTYTSGSIVPIYRSVGPEQPNALATGSGNNLTISGSIATFASAISNNIGVGDAIEYDTNADSTVNAIAFIHRRNSSTSYLVASTAGGTPTAVTNDQDWSIYRAYTSLFNAEAGTTNSNISVSFDTWSGGRDLTSTGESWNIALYDSEDSGFSSCGDTISYSGQSYSTVEIGTQCWMGENLNVGARISTCVSGDCSGDCASSCSTRGTTIKEQTDNDILEKYCYADTESNCTNEGGLYQWDEAMDYVETEGTQGICPEGWHIPTDAEWHTLENYLATGTCSSTRIGNDCDPAGTALKTGGSSGFEGILAGDRYTDGSFFNRGTTAYFWSSSVSGTSAWYRYLYSGNTTVNRATADQAVGFSIRCLKD